MGIPGLSKPLKPYAVSTTVGCKTPHCSEHKPAISELSRSIVIDGPSFAYSIYHRLIIQKPEWLTAVEAMPSYDELGQGALAFLDDLEDYGLKVKHIYFDGYLPPHKRDVRLDRLQRSLQKLSTYYTISQKLLLGKRGWEGRPLQPSVVFPSGSPTVSAFRGLPPATFVVPAVLDALGASKYAAVTRVVPGEAEVYCAAAAREDGGIILSNDSDLFVHDLGNGAFVYLDSVELRTNEINTQTENPSSCKPLNLEIFRPRAIAQRIGIKTLQDLAFQFLLNHSSTLSSAITATKSPQSIEEELAYQNFIQEYTTSPSTSETHRFSPLARSRLHAHASFLDPRISELICQLESNNDTDTTNVYLLPLIEDPTRSSAWNVSSSHRSFAYSILTHYLPKPPNSNFTSNPPTNITANELHRRAQTFTFRPLPLLPLPSLLAYAHPLLTHLHLFSTTFPSLPPTLIYRTYALFHTYLHHLSASKIPPSYNLLQRVLTGRHTPHPDWGDIHLEAEVQGVLYALRMMGQVLGYVAKAREEEEGRLEGELVELGAALRDLPGLAKLIPSPFELREVVEREGVDVEGVMKKLAILFQEEVGDEEGLGEVVRQGFRNEGNVAGPTWMTVGKKKKRKKKKREERQSEGVDKGDGNNMFRLLA